MKEIKQIPANKDIICQGSALNFVKAQPSSKQQNPIGFCDADATKSSGCLTPADMTLFSGIGIKQIQFHKRPFLMLEVLIAFAIIALCAIPLISPHVQMIKAQKQLINQTNIQHLVNGLYVTLLEKLHKNEISLNDIENKKVFTIEQEALKSVHGYKANYQFLVENSKKRNPDGLKTYLVILQLNFIPITSGKKLSYDYKIFIASKNTPGPVNDDEEGDEDEEV